MEKIVFLVERTSTEETTLSSAIMDALELSHNFSSNYKITRFQSEEVEECDLEHDSEYVFIRCPHCNNSEQHPIGEQRSHLQMMEVTEWLDDEGETERSLMKCGDCHGEFIQLWEYSKDEELEEVEWNYSCSTSTLWGSFDFGMVLAKTREEAEAKAKAELEARVVRMNELLGEEYTINISIDALEVSRND